MEKMKSHLDHAQQKQNEALQRAEMAERQANVSLLQLSSSGANTLQKSCSRQEALEDKTKHATEKEATAVAVGLTLECDYDSMLGDGKDGAGFNEGLAREVQTALGIARSSVQVLCHQRGSIKAEIVLRRSDDGQGNVLTTEQAAMQVVELMARQDGLLLPAALLSFASRAELHGAITEALVSAVDSVVQNAAKRMAESHQVVQHLLAKLDAYEEERTRDLASGKADKQKRLASQQTHDDWRQALSWGMLEVETVLDTLCSQLQQSMGSERALRSALNDSIFLVQALTQTNAQHESNQQATIESLAGAEQQRDSLLCRVDSLSLHLSATEQERDSLLAAVDETAPQLEQRHLVLRERDELQREITTIRGECKDLTQMLSIAQTQSQEHLANLAAHEDTTAITTKQVHQRYGAIIQSLWAAVIELENTCDELKSRSWQGARGAVFQVAAFACRTAYQPANVALGSSGSRVSRHFYVKTPFKAPPKFCTSKEIKNARNYMLLDGVLKLMYVCYLQRQCLRRLGVWIGRLQSIRTVSELVLRSFYEYVLQDQMIHWRNMKRRLQHCRRIACRNLGDATAPRRSLRQLADSFLWWRVTSSGCSR